MTEHNITLFEACEILNKSKKTVSRYVRRGRLNPLKVKSQQGTLEYRFSKDDLDRLRAELAIVDRTDKTQQTGQAGYARQDTQQGDLPLNTEEITPAPDKTRPDRTEETGQPHSIINLLKETTELLKHQLTIKDTQIETLNDQVHKLIERDRETNILLKGLQDRLMLLEPPKHKETETPDQTGRGRRERTRLLVLAVLLLLTLALFFYTNILPALPSLKLLYESLTK